MKTIDYSDFFSSFNNAFGLNADDHNVNADNICSSEEEYFGYTDDLIKAFSKCTVTLPPSPDNSDLKDDEDERENYLIPYIYQSHLSTARIRSSSAPIPIAKLNAARCLFSRYNSKSVQPSPLLQQTKPMRSSTLSLSSTSSSCQSIQTCLFVDTNESNRINRDRALTVPIPDTALDYDLALNDIVQSGF